MSLQTWTWSSSDGNLKLTVTEDSINYSTNKSNMVYKLVAVKEQAAGTVINWEIPGVDSGSYTYSFTSRNVTLVSDSYWTSHNADGTATKWWSATASVRDPISGTYSNWSVPTKALVLTPITVPSYTLQPVLSVSLVNAFNGQALSGRTKLALSVSNMGANYGVTPTWQAQITTAGGTITSPSISGNGSWTSDIINYAGSVSIVITATDSRGAGCTPATSSKTFVAYAIPTLSVKGIRCDSAGNENILGTYYKVTETHTVDTSIPGNDVQSIVIKANGVTVNAGQVYSGLSVDSTLSVVATITDNVGSSATQTIVINKGRFLFKGNMEHGLSFGVPIDVPGITINGNDIIEYGSGYNSASAGTRGTEYWYKFSNGLLIKRGSITRTMGMSVWTSPIYYTADATITFNTAVPFVAAPDVNISASVSNTVWGAAQNISATQFAYNFMRAGSLSSTSWTIHYTAIGRWK